MFFLPLLNPSESFPLLICAFRGGNGGKGGKLLRAKGRDWCDMIVMKGGPWFMSLGMYDDGGGGGGVGQKPLLCEG